MKKFTKVIKKAALTGAAFISLMTNIYGHDDVTQYFDVTNWPGTYTNNTSITGDRTAVELNDLTGTYTNTNTGIIYGNQGYGILSFSYDKEFEIINNGTIGNINNNTSTGVNLAGWGGILTNNGIISSGNVGIFIDSEGPIDKGFFIDNNLIINGSVAGVHQINSEQKVTLYNGESAYISGTSVGMSLAGIADITNDGLIQGQYNAAISLGRGGTVTNNGIISGKLGNAIQHYGFDVQLDMVILLLMLCSIECMLVLVVTMVQRYHQALLLLLYHHHHYY